MAMTDITLSNVAGGGTQSITLNFVIDYIVADREDYGTHSVPGKTTPTVDTDTVVKHPRTISIDARVTATVKSNLQTMRSERKTIDLSDGEESNVDCRMTELSFRHGIEITDPPWVATITLITTAS